MGQEVKNPLRAQSKYGLMGSSAKTGKIFFKGHWSTFWIKMQFGIGHPPPTHQLQSTCVGEASRVPNLQTEFNYLDSFKSYGIFSDFVVPRGPHIVPVIPMLSPSSPCHPHHPHIVPIAPRRSPCGPHGCGLRGLLHCLRGLHPMLSPWSPSSPHHPRHPHVIPVSSPSSPCCPHSPQKVSMAVVSVVSSVVSVVSTPCCPRGPHGPHRPHVVPVVLTSSRRSPHHP